MEPVLIFYSLKKFYRTAIYLNREKDRLGIENETLKSEKTELLSMQEKMRIELLQQLDKITMLEKHNESLRINISESEISTEISKRIKERIDIIDSETYIISVH